MKSIRSLTIILPMLTSLAIIPANGYCRHHHKPIVNQAIKPMPLSQYSQDGVTVTTRALNKEEIHKLFKGRGSALFSRKNPIVPIEVSIANESNEAVSFDLTRTNLKLATEKEILKRLQYNTPLRTAILGSLLLASVPLCLYSYLSILFGGFVLADEFIFIGAMIATYNPLLVIGTGTLICVTSTTYGYSLHRTNKKLAAELKRNITNGIATIQPHEEQSFLLFVQGNELHNFDIVLQSYDPANGDTMFPVIVN